MKKALTVVALAAAVSFALPAYSETAIAGGRGSAGQGQMLRDGSHVGTQLPGSRIMGNTQTTRGQLGDGTQPKPLNGAGLGYGNGSQPRPLNGTGFGTGK